MGSVIGWFIVYLCVLLGGLYWAYRWQLKRRGAMPTFRAWVTPILGRFRLLIGIGMIAVPVGLGGVLGWRLTGILRNLGELFAMGFAAATWIVVAAAVVGIFAALIWVLTMPTRLEVRSNQKKVNKFYEDNVKRFATNRQTMLNEWGGTFEDRTRRIDDAFNDRTMTMEYSFASRDFAPRYGRKPWTWLNGGVIHGNAYSVGTALGFAVSRNLSTMSPKACELLRCAEHINNALDGVWDEYDRCKFGIIWEDGKGRHAGSAWYFGDGGNKPPEDANTSTDSMMRWIVDQRLAKFEAVTSIVLEEVNKPSPDNQRLEDVKARFREVFNRSGGDGAAGPSSSAWLRGADIANSVFSARSPHAIRIGILDDGTPIEFSGDESLITIAPPGSGKTQCNVFPTLLRWKGPALVLDISGDIYEKTSKWRSEHVGPVYKFAPLDPERSHRWSPLAFVRSDPDYIWEDSRLLAELMIVPGGGKDPFWEDNARIFLTAAIASVVYSSPQDQRPMHRVLDMMHGGEAWETMMTTLRLAVDVRAMPQHATSIGSMEEKTRDSIRQTARASLAAWAGERVARATAGSDWSPLDLRSGGNSTVYIVVQPHEVEAYLSMLRVFIGQHIRMLFSAGPPKHGACPTLIMLDEMPRLRRMPPIDEALNIGRRFGLRLWMFAQSFGQLEEAYENAEGMVASCGVRIYMNPSSADGTAEKIAEQIGYRSGPMDGNRQLIIEPNALSGSGFKDHQIVLGKGCKPARVRKVMAWQDAEINSRFGEHQVARTSAAGRV